MAVRKRRVIEAIIPCPNNGQVLFEAVSRTTVEIAIARDGQAISMPVSVADLMEAVEHVLLEPK